MVGDPAEYGRPSNDLAEELLTRSFGDGANVGLWPGMTIYRYVEPTVPKWDEIPSLSVCIVAQGRKAVTADGHEYVYDQYQYLVLRSNLHFTSQILDARRFRELTGRSPYQFVKETRLERARELLLERRLAIGDVSVAVGYASLSHFTKEFRTRFGTTPGEYADADGLSRDLRATR